MLFVPPRCPSARIFRIVTPARSQLCADRRRTYEVRRATANGWNAKACPAIAMTGRGARAALEEIVARINQNLERAPFSGGQETRVHGFSSPCSRMGAAGSQSPGGKLPPGTSKANVAFYARTRRPYKAGKQSGIR